LKSLFQVCFLICITLLLFTLSLNLISGLGVFGFGEVSSPELEGTTESLFTRLSGFEGGMGTVWAVVTTAAGVLSVAAAVLMRSTTPIGIYLFSAVFWTSYTRFIGFVNINNLFVTGVLSGFLLIVTVGLLFIWVGALIGMLTGSG
jgi:hypothetical protein